jgi:hypothetical protein
MPAQQGRWFIATLKWIEGGWTPDQVNLEHVDYIRGQLEQPLFDQRELPDSDCDTDIIDADGEVQQVATGYKHWQFVFHTARKVTLLRAKSYFPDFIHLEFTRSEAAVDYCWKEDTRVEGSQFERGARPVRQQSKVDWEEVWKHAENGCIDKIPAAVRFRHYSTIRNIAKDFLSVGFIQRECEVHWGVTGAGKSHAAWSSALGVNLGDFVWSEGKLVDDSGSELVCSSVFTKQPSTKWWDGYRGQEVVVIEEFTGKIGVEHLLRWLDHYPVSVEIKGSEVPLKAKRFVITSNVDPRDWYPDICQEQRDALMRRLGTIKRYTMPFVRNVIPATPVAARSRSIAFEEAFE